MTCNALILYLTIPCFTRLYLLFFAFPTLTSVSPVQPFPSTQHALASSLNIGYSSSTQLPLSSTSKTSQSTSTFSSLKIRTISWAILSKFSVARARMVGPAPERQIPRRPGWVVGVTDERILGRPGIWD
jgi:hypothetical protein